MPTARAWLCVAALLASGCTLPPAPDHVSAALATLAATVETAAPDQAASILGAVAPFARPDTWPTPDQAVLARATEIGNGTPHLFGLWGAALHVRLHGASPGVAQPWADTLTDGRVTATPSITDEAWALAGWLLLGSHGDREPLLSWAATLHDARAFDGGWAWDGGVAGGTDETAWAVRALVLMGDGERVRDRAVSFFASQQRTSGLYATAGVGPNCQSTGLAVQALRWLDAPVPPNTWDALDACWNGDGWAHVPGGPTDVWATTDILSAYWPDAVFALAPDVR